MNSNALHIKGAVARFAVFDLKHVLVAIEPSFSSHDVWTMSAARRQYEWEVKQSIADLRREAKKWKHRSGHILRPQFADGWPNKFYIVVPKALGTKADKWITANLPYAGLALVEGATVTVVRDAALLHKGKADLKRCSRVARWMAVTVADLMERTSNGHQ